MAPKAKFDPNDPAAVALASLFKSVGITQTKAAETVRNPKSAASLSELIDRNELLTKHLDEKQGSLVLHVAVQGSKLNHEEQDYATKAIVDSRLKNIDQVTASIKYLETHPLLVDEKEFDSECGVGVTVTAEQVFQSVSEYITSNSVAGWAGLSSVLSGVKNTPGLRWASTLNVKTSVERAFTERFGPKEAAKPKTKVVSVHMGVDEHQARTNKAALQEPKQQAVSNPEKKPSGSSQVDPSSTKAVFEQGFLGSLHKPGENTQSNTRLHEQHLAVTKGQVWTRFPPEPNGYLHIGHSKAIFINFGYAAHYGGRCYLRYDDTNPEAEEAQYFESILEIVRWLGYEPWRITYSSDYFSQLYELAVELIRRGKGYICHCTGEEIKANRGEKEGVSRKACVHRDRPISESLAEFEGMKNGKYRRGEATLRMKQDLEDGNPQMWDLIAYRVVDAPHHRTGDKWRIYPTYDFTHCLVDSFENISHSLCTTEFILSRVSYEWLCDAVEVYKPRQSEFGRLNMQGTITSKRKILALVKEGHVQGWDDPRLFTLVALRRRGIPPGAITSFIGSLGVSNSTSLVETARFDQAIRQHLENTAPRLLMVLRPLKVTIENLPVDYVLLLEKPLYPKLPDAGTSTIPFTRTLYIDADDFRLQDSKDYFRLAPGKTVGLLQAPYPITCTSYKTDPSSGDVVELICRLEDGKGGETPKKPKAFIQWVAEHPATGSPVRVDETRIFHPLFRSDNPAASPDYKADLNPESLEVVNGALVDVGFWSLSKKAIGDARKEGKVRTENALANGAVASPIDADTPRPTSDQLVGNESVRFQGPRVAYFTLDKDARLACLGEDENVTPGRQEGDILILNRIVSLKEDSGKTV